TNTPPPQVTAASFAVTEGQSVVLSAANFAITDLDPHGTSFTYTVTSTHGTFQVQKGNTWHDVTSFTSADLAAGNVRFHSDGSDFKPSFTVTVDDGTTVNNVSVSFPDSLPFSTGGAPPQITAASFAVTEGQSVLLSAANFAITDPDPDGTSFTYTVTS